MKKSVGNRRFIIHSVIIHDRNGGFVIDNYTPNGITLKQGLDRKTLDAVRRLAESCERHDGIRLKLNWDMLESRPDGETNDLLFYDQEQLAGFCGIYRLVSSEAELSGMVHPDYRRRGIFTQLAAGAAELCRERGLRELIYICPRSSEAGQGFVRHRGLPYRDSEYVMELGDTSAAPLSAAGLRRPCAAGRAEPNRFRDTGGGGFGACGQHDHAS